MNTLIPVPASVEPAEGSFALTDDSCIWIRDGNEELAAIAEYLANKLRPSMGFALPVVSSVEPPVSGSIVLQLDASVDLGDEGYLLLVEEEGVTLTAAQPEGLFRGIQTLRQLLPPEIEHANCQPGPWSIPAGVIRDKPRYAWRGAMLDVARHFFSVDVVKRYIDLIAYYKLNRFHLHLTDDQGWRIEIKSWPNLAGHGGKTQIGGGKGGYYTQEQYAEIVAYAQARYITVIPEIDMPGHSRAALASYPELNCDDISPDIQTTYEISNDTLCIRKEITYQYVSDVLGEVAALTPGPYLHIGGDEAAVPNAEDYRYFIARVQETVARHGKVMVGWEEIADIELLPDTIAQHWNTDPTRIKVSSAPNVIMSPGDRAYLDMKYTEASPLGLWWAGYVPVSKAYTWDPAQHIEGLDTQRIIGVEAPLWSETLETSDHIDYMAFPRLLGIAEIGWSPGEGRDWSEYRTRLGAHGRRLSAMGVNYFASDEVLWM